MWYESLVAVVHALREERCTACHELLHWKQPNFEGEPLVPESNDVAEEKTVVEAPEPSWGNFFQPIHAVAVSTVLHLNSLTKLVWIDESGLDNKEFDISIELHEDLLRKAYNYLAQNVLNKLSNKVVCAAIWAVQRTLGQQVQGFTQKRQQHSEKLRKQKEKAALAKDASTNNADTTVGQLYPVPSTSSIVIMCLSVVHEVLLRSGQSSKVTEVQALLIVALFTIAKHRREEATADSSDPPCSITVLVEKLLKRSDNEKKEETTPIALDSPKSPKGSHRRRRRSSSQFFRQSSGARAMDRKYLLQDTLTSIARTVYRSYPSGPDPYALDAPPTLASRERATTADAFIDSLKSAVKSAAAPLNIDTVYIDGAMGVCVAAEAPCWMLRQVACLDKLATRACVRACLTGIDKEDGYNRLFSDYGWHDDDSSDDDSSDNDSIDDDEDEDDSDTDSDNDASNQKRKQSTSGRRRFKGFIDAAPTFRAAVTKPLRMPLHKFLRGE